MTNITLKWFGHSPVCVCICVVRSQESLNFSCISIRLEHTYTLVKTYIQVPLNRRRKDVEFSCDITQFRHKERNINV